MLVTSRPTNYFFVLREPTHTVSDVLHGNQISAITLSHLNQSLIDLAKTTSEYYFQENFMRVYCLAFAAVLSLFAVEASAQQAVQVTVENLQPTDGFYVTPVWVGFHDGNFDYFDAGSAASSAVEDLAEGGDLAGLAGEFAAFGSGQGGVLTGPNGFGSGAGEPPVIDPGESSSMIFNLGASERFLSFASMVIPSNDGFFGNDSGTAIEVLDASGNFSFAGPLDIGLANLWDSGTELNDGQGAAFSANGGTSTDTTDPIALHAGLDNFDGTSTAAGTTINFTNASGSPVLRLSVTAVPEPGSLALLGLAGTIGLLRRRRS